MIDGWRGWQPGVPLLDGRVALVAGGGRGIGEACSRILAASGAAVAVLDVIPERAEEVAKRIVDSGGRAAPVIADLRIGADCQRAVDDAVRALGALDILVNVAGGMRSADADWVPLKKWTTEQWDAIVHMNLRYVFWMARAAIPEMEKRGGGSIVSIASISGVAGSPMHSAYGAAKAGLIHLTKTLAAELGRSRIRVNAASPGTARTPASMEGRTPEQIATADALQRKITPLGRPGIPEDLARAVLFFASPMAEFISGQMILVDGGVSTKFPFAIRGTDSSMVGVIRPEI